MPMTRAESQANDRARAKKARAELAEFCTKPRDPRVRQLSLRAVNCVTMRMGYSTVIAGQMENWIFGHMLAFAWKEAKRAARAKGARKK
jgi:hypothetical protein